MTFEFSRVDYMAVGLTFPNTTKLLPAYGSTPQQKVVVGDRDGVVQCFHLKDEEPQVDFKTLPGKDVACVQLGGTPGAVADKIFISSYNEVKGYTKKGKLFLALETNLSEPITSMYVLGSDLVVASGNTLTHYHDLQEISTFICDHRIVDIVWLSSSNSHKLRLLLAVSNKAVLLIENGKRIANLLIPSRPTRFMVPPTDLLEKQDPLVFFGTKHGTVGIIRCQNDAEVTQEPLLENLGLGAVTCLSWWTTASENYLLIGRDDGAIQVYLLDLENILGSPKLKFSYFSGETVTSVLAGSVGRPGVQEIVVTTYSGRIFGLRPHDNIMESQAAISTRLSKLQAEVLKLEKRVSQERERYQRSTHAPLHAGLSAPPLLQLQHELHGADKGGWRDLHLTSGSALELLLVHCTNPLELQTDGAAVLSECPSQEGREYLASIRCQAGTYRLRLRLRGYASASLRVYVVPAGAPRVARLLTYQLCSLPQYHAPTYDDEDEDLRVWARLEARGQFSVAQLSWWLGGVLVGELPRPAPRVAFARTHALIGTVLHCQYQKGEAIFKSDDVSALLILKDLITTSGIQKNITMDIKCYADMQCVLGSFLRVQTLFESEFNKKQKAYLREALSEMEIDTALKDSEMQLLCDDYMNSLKETAEESENYIDILIDIICNWYSDLHKIQARQCNTNTMTRLRDSLNSCSVEEVKNILITEFD